MTSKHLDKEIWINIFKECGLSEEMMNQWHKVFESLSPEGHQEFLEWIQIKMEDIEKIRKNSK